MTFYGARVTHYIRYTLGAGLTGEEFVAEWESLTDDEREELRVQARREVEAEVAHRFNDDREK